MSCYKVFLPSTYLPSTFPSVCQETSARQAEVNDQRRQLEQESAMRLELENNIMTHMQQKLTHNNAAKYSQKLTSKIATLKQEKVGMGFRKF